MKLKKIIALIAFTLVAAISFAQEKGQIAVTTKSVSFKASRSDKAAVYSTAPAGTHIVVATQKNGWSGVVMEDGRTGWVRSSALKMTAYQAVYSRSQQAKRQQLASRARGAQQSVMSKIPNGNALTQASLEYLGIPYVWGGNTPQQGLDCSGFIKHLFARFGVNLPRRATHQMYRGQVIARYEDLRPGDRLYFSDRGRTRITHTGLYLGNGYFIHANRSANKVSIDYLFTRKWMSITVGARR